MQKGHCHNRQEGEQRGVDPAVDRDTSRIREKSAVQSAPKDSGELQLLLKAKNKTHLCDTYRPYFDALIWIAYESLK